MEGATKVEVNGREYTVIMLSPTQAHDFYHEYTAAEMRRESIGRFNKTAIDQCCNPMMRPLKDAATFEQWFSEHPEDLILLGALARNALIFPFLPKASNTSKTATN